MQADADIPRSPMARLECDRLLRNTETPPTVDCSSSGPPSVSPATGSSGANRYLAGYGAGKAVCTCQSPDGEKRTAGNLDCDCYPICHPQTGRRGIL
ncbi:hypothetical protein AAFF_G00097270 [Aldrovandia affinis]|uniref:Uncharacterized protein n=1 Tax=Aldrovandia affinis TaxID=143900 RepID=A0AAD7WBK5_9TELE|nr:hypothetical protein AAFF_G00097270 [Aldrovandia affinis]